MKKLFSLAFIFLGTFLASSASASFSLDNLYIADLHFFYNGNIFGGKFFFSDVKDVSETLILSGIPKSCTKQVRGYYYNAARGLRLWPLDQDSLNVLKAFNSSYNNLTLDGGLFVCGSNQAVYGSVHQVLNGMNYYLVAGVDYNFTNNSYLPNFMQSMLFAGGQSFGHVFDNNGGIASIFGRGLPTTAVCGNAVREVGETCDEGVTNGQIGHCNVFCNGVASSNAGGGAGGGGGGAGGGVVGTVDIPLFSGLLTTGNITIIPPVIKQIVPLRQPCAVINSPYSAEVTESFGFAYSMGITSQCPIESANLPGLVLRKHAAKMIAQFAINVLGKKIDATKQCNFIDIKNDSTELQRYMKIACQLGIMGLDSAGKPNTNFSPDVTLSRAQFGTMLSRLLRGTAYNGMPGQYYTAHLQALNLNGIMKNISDPNMYEKRQNVLIMFYRIANPTK